MRIKNEELFELQVRELETNGFRQIAPIGGWAMRIPVDNATSTGFNVLGR